MAYNNKTTKSLLSLKGAIDSANNSMQVFELAKESEEKREVSFTKQRDNKIKQLEIKQLDPDQKRNVVSSLFGSSYEFKEHKVKKKFESKIKETKKEIKNLARSEKKKLKKAKDHVTKDLKKLVKDLEKTYDKDMNPREFLELNSKFTMILDNLKQLQLDESKIFKSEDKEAYEDSLRFVQKSNDRIKKVEDFVKNLQNSNTKIVNSLFGSEQNANKAVEAVNENRKAIDELPRAKFKAEQAKEVLKDTPRPNLFMRMIGYVAPKSFKDSLDEKEKAHENAVTEKEAADKDLTETKKSLRESQKEYNTHVTEPFNANKKTPYFKELVKAEKKLIKQIAKESVDLFKEFEDLPSLETNAARAALEEQAQSATQQYDKVPPLKPVDKSQNVKAPSNPPTPLSTPANSMRSLNNSFPEMSVSHQNPRKPQYIQLPPEQYNSIPQTRTEGTSEKKPNAHQRVNKTKALRDPETQYDSMPKRAPNAKGQILEVLEGDYQDIDTIFYDSAVDVQMALHNIKRDTPLMSDYAINKLEEIESKSVQREKESLEKRNPVQRRYTAPGILGGNRDDLSPTKKELMEPEVGTYSSTDGINQNSSQYSSAGLSFRDSVPSLSPTMTSNSGIWGTNEYHHSQGSGYGVVEFTGFDINVSNQGMSSQIAPDSNGSLSLVHQNAGLTGSTEFSTSASLDASVKWEVDPDKEVDLFGGKALEPLPLVPHGAMQQKSASRSGAGMESITLSDELSQRAKLAGSGLVNSATEDSRIRRHSQNQGFEPKTPDSAISQGHSQGSVGKV